MAKLVKLLNGSDALATEITPFAHTQEGVASLLTVHIMKTRDSIHAYAEFIRANGAVVGIDISFFAGDCTVKDVVKALYRMERLMNNKSIVMLASVFRLAIREMFACNYSIYSVSPDFVWQEISSDERL